MMVVNENKTASNVARCAFKKWKKVNKTVLCCDCCENKFHTNMLLSYLLSTEMAPSHLNFQNQVGSSETTNSNAIYSCRDFMPQKYATLPRNHNPFEVSENGFWKTKDKTENLEKVEVLKRKEWKKMGKNMNAYGRSCSYGNLQSANPFTTDSPGAHNPFSSYCRDK